MFYISTDVAMNSIFILLCVKNPHTHKTLSIVSVIQSVGLGFGFVFDFCFGFHLTRLLSYHTLELHKILLQHPHNQI